MKVELNNLEFVSRTATYDDRGFLISDTVPSIDGSAFTTGCTVDFGGMDNCKATFYIDIDCEVGCLLQVGDMDIGIGLGFNDLYALKLYLDDLFAMPNDGSKLKLSSDEINGLLKQRDTQYQQLWRAKNES